jgi:ABC-type phosphate transport system permease subunit
VTVRSEVRSRRTMWRKAKSDLMMGVTVLATVITLLPLFIILAYLAVKGASSLNLAFFTRRSVRRAGGWPTRLSAHWSLSASRV